MKLDKCGGVFYNVLPLRGQTTENQTKKIALIIGGSRGIGRSVALRLGVFYSRVSLFDRVQRVRVWKHAPKKEELVR